MAVSEIGQALTEAHRVAQRALTGQAAKAMSRLWNAVDPLDPVSWLHYVETTAELCAAAQTASAEAAARYFQEFRRVELQALGMAVEGLTLTSPGFALTGDIEAALETYGPAYVRRMVASGVPLEEVKRLALSGQLGNTTGRILSPARQVVGSGIERDRQCIGYRRCCSGAACSFCAMLATRGAVYKENSFSHGYKGQRISLSAGTAKGSKGGRGAEVHRSCQCWMEPVYSRASRPSPNVARYESLWATAKGDPIEFRRLVEGRA